MTTHPHDSATANFSAKCSAHLIISEASQKVALSALGRNGVGNT
jgi:hypothetical protein